MPLAPRVMSLIDWWVVALRGLVILVGLILMRSVVLRLFDLLGEMSVGLCDEALHGSHELLPHGLHHV